MISKVIQGWPADRLLVNYNIHNVCNYECWYCFPGSHEGDKRWPDTETITKNVLHLLDYYRSRLGKTIIEFHLLGGEPTLWPDLERFIGSLKNSLGSNIIICMTTNGSRTVRWWQDHGSNFDKVLISCHPDKVDPDHIVQVSDILYDKGKLVDALVLMDPFQWDHCIDIVDKLSTSDRGWGVQVSRLIHDRVSYTPEQEEYLKNYMKKPVDVEWFMRVNKNHKYTVTVDDVLVDKNHLVANRLNKFYGWRCNLGVDNISINNGLLSGQCGEYLYDLDFYYDLHKDDFIDTFHPDITTTTCKKLFCNCQHEWNTTKIKICR
jgi:organic radical activating enzyme